MPRILAACALAALLATSASAQSSLVIENRTGSSVHYLYISACSATSWGEDELGSDTIPAGDSYTFRVAPGCWDFKVTFADGDELTQSRQQVRRGASLTWTLGSESAPARAGRGDASSGSFVVANDTDQSILYFYASACSRDSWGEDQLGSDTVPSGESYTFSVSPGCWDFKVRLADGQETIQRRQSIRAGGSLRWNISSD